MWRLKQKRIWVAWNYRLVDGRLTKKPISIYGTPTGTDEAYSHTWATYDEAVAAKEKYGFSGIGFVVPKGYFFLDIDHMDLSDPFVQLLMERFATYVERSVSGKGLHLYGMCDLSKLPTYTEEKGILRLSKDFYTKNPHNSLELYVGGLTNRYAVYTGDAVNDVEFNECTSAILTTLDKDMRKKPKTNYSEKRDGDDRGIFDVVCSLRKQKNGEKFCKLYDKGDFSDYRSQSEADNALCAMIAFRTGDDPAAIDQIFRSSALYRDKWEREDYRENTIVKGIEACHGTFHKSKMEHPPFIRFNEKSGEPYVVVPLLAKYIRENIDYILVRDSGKQGTLLFVYEDGAYRLYSKDMMLGVIKAPVAAYDEELVRMGMITEAYNLITTDLNYVGQDELNADETIINFQNGLLRVTDKELNLISHAPDVYSTIQIPCRWIGQQQPTPVFDQYLKTLTNGDDAVAQLLLEFIGVCISNIKGWRMKKSLFLVGDGDTGKSQLKSLVELLLGRGNFIGIDLKEIEARFGTGAIYGTRLAGSSDMSFLSVDELKTFKKITGGDSLFAEFKGQQGFEYTYNGVLWFCMNRLPKFGGDDGQWVYDRIMVVRCPNVIPKDQQDKKLLDKLYAERDGIV